MVNQSKRGGMKEAAGKRGGTKKHQGVRPGSTAIQKERTKKDPRRKLVPDSRRGKNLP